MIATVAVAGLSSACGQGAAAALPPIPWSTSDALATIGATAAPAAAGAKADAAPAAAAAEPGTADYTVAGRLLPLTGRAAAWRLGSSIAETQLDRLASAFGITGGVHATAEGWSASDTARTLTVQRSGGDFFTVSATTTGIACPVGVPVSGSPGEVGSSSAGDAGSGSSSSSSRHAGSSGDAGSGSSPSRDAGPSSSRHASPSSSRHADSGSAGRAGAAGGTALRVARAVATPTIAAGPATTASPVCPPPPPVNAPATRQPAVDPAKATRQASAGGATTTADPTTSGVAKATSVTGVTATRVTDTPVTALPVTDPAVTGTRVSGTPVTGLPTEARSIQLVREVLTRAGLPVSGALAGATMNGTGWTVTLSPSVGGATVANSPFVAVVGAGPTITSVTGYMATPVYVGDYPLTGTPEALMRLRQGVDVLSSSGAAGSDAVSGSAGAFPPRSTTPAMTCPTNAMCAPLPSPSPITPTITGAHLALALVPSDGSPSAAAWLAPAYVFDLSDGSTATVLAVPDRDVTITHSTQTGGASGGVPLPAQATGRSTGVIRAVTGSRSPLSPKPGG